MAYAYFFPLQIKQPCWRQFGLGVPGRGPAGNGTLSLGDQGGTGEPGAEASPGLAPLGAEWGPSRNTEETGGRKELLTEAVAQVGALPTVACRGKARGHGHMQEEEPMQHDNYTIETESLGQENIKVGVGAGREPCGPRRELTPLAQARGLPLSSGPHSGPLGMFSCHEVLASASCHGG